MRGKLAWIDLDGTPCGLIPACAGKTPLTELKHLLNEAHPRVCGENWETGKTEPFDPGSSPRVRGKRLRRGEVACINGLIPACAGKTVRR